MPAAGANWPFGLGLAALLIAGPLSAQAREETLELAVTLNGRANGGTSEFVSRDGALLARPAELTALGLRLPATTDREAQRPIALASLGVGWRLDPSSQTLFITAAADRLVPSTLSIDRADPGTAPNVAGSSLGATLNYDISATATAGRAVSAGYYDLRLFAPWGVASSTALSTMGRSAYGASAVVRLDTSYTWSDPDSLRRVRAGDFITGSLDETRPVRLLGVQLASDFALRPDLVTFPLPSISGSVAVPSTVDLLVDGTRLLSRQVAPGPFEIPQIPVVSGAGTISMAVTDALGHQTVLSLPFYAGAGLLAPGLQSYSAQLGLVRRAWGVRSDDYGALAGVATYRRGLTRGLTLELATEGAGDTITGTGGVALDLAGAAELSVSAAASRAKRAAGSQFAAAIARYGRVFQVTLSATAASPGFSDVAALNGDPVPRLRLNAGIGRSFGRFGAMNLSYAALERMAATSLALPMDRGVQRDRLLSASYSVTAWGVSVYATGFRDFAGRGAAGAVLGLTVPLGPRRSAGASLDGGSGAPSARIEAQQTPSAPGEWGFDGAAATDGGGHEFAQVQYEAPWSDLTAGIDHDVAGTSWRGEAAGAVTVLDRGVFASRRIQDSFAVVDTGGLAGVQVLDENRDAGRTDAAGRLLVPDLRAYEVNHIAIDADDVPQDSTADTTAQTVRPADRSGVVVTFPIHVSNGALLSLTEPSGAPIPLGSVATLGATGRSVPVGYDGQAYVTDLRARNDLIVERPDGTRCALAFAYRPLRGEIPAIGPLACQPVAR